MSKKGFTLIELMVAITIMAVVSSIGYVTYRNAQIASRDGRRKINMREIQPGLELYFQRNNTFPPNLAALVPTYASRIPTEPVPPSPTYEYHLVNPASYVICTTLENTSDPDIPTTIHPSCSAGSNFFVAYP